MATILKIGTEKRCECTGNKINCLTAKDWIKCQLGVWQFNYEKRDIRDKELHPATFPISLATKVISLFSHKGELIIDPFNGSGTTLLAAKDLDRNAIGFDINTKYCELSKTRLTQTKLHNCTKQITKNDDARNIDRYLPLESVTLSFTSPPYANLLNRQRENKSRRGNKRKNSQYLKIEQYSQNKNDLGILDPKSFTDTITEIYTKVYCITKPGGHAVINISDVWWQGERIALHLNIIDALTRAGFKLKNTIIWDRTNIVNNIGIFGWPSNYITMGTTFEYLLDFYKPKD